jgi:hypothetical protein
MKGNNKDKDEIEQAVLDKVVEISLGWILSTNS